MLNENLKTLRKTKGLSQEELAAQLHVVRQTISKWEQSLSVPDAAQLIGLAAALDTDVATLLGETPAAAEPEGIQALAAKLELLNEQFARELERKRKTWRIVSIAALVVAAVTLFRILLPLFFYLYLSAKEAASTAIIGGADGPTAITVVSSLQFLPFLGLLAVIIVAIIGICRTRRK